MLTSVKVWLFEPLDPQAIAILVHSIHKRPIGIRSSMSNRVCHQTEVSNMVEPLSAQAIVRVCFQEVTKLRGISERCHIFVQESLLQGLHVGIMGLFREQYVRAPTNNHFAFHKPTVQKLYKLDARNAELNGGGLEQALSRCNVVR